jgi:hypothetical protein
MIYTESYLMKTPNVDGCNLMLFLLVGIWLVIVYALRVALFGNPLANMLRTTDPTFLEHVDMVTAHNGPYTEESVHFLRRFSRLSLLELGAFLLETALLIYFLTTGRLVMLCVFILIKNVVMFFLSLYLARRRRETLGANFKSLQALPEWIHRSDRLSSLVSGLGFIALFVNINGWM